MVLQDKISRFDKDTQQFKQLKEELREYIDDIDDKMLF